MNVMELKAELMGNHELLINGESWEASQSKICVNEELVAKLTLAQQWALLSMMQQAVMRLHWVYGQSRMKAHDVLPSDAERMERMRRSPKPELPKSRVIVTGG